MANIEKSKPEFVTRDGIIADADYVQWLSDVKKRFSDSTGFSYSNVKYMKRWHNFYNELVIKGQQAADLLEFPAVFGRIPWGQNIHIFSTCQEYRCGMVAARHPKTAWCSNLPVEASSRTRGIGVETT